MRIPQKTFANYLVTVLAIVGVIIYFFQPGNTSATRSLKIDLKDATFDFAIKGDTVDVNLLLTKLITAEQYRDAVKGILNGHGYYGIDDTTLIDALEKVPPSNSLVTELRTLAAGYSSIFSNDLRPTTLTIADNVPVGLSESAACKNSEYFGKDVLLSNQEESIFYITRITKPWACSKNENKIYVNREVGRYISGCKPLAGNQLSIKVQKFTDSGFPRPTQLCNS
ncbi:MAG: hypothetical protein PVJ39_04915 [Gammaproteobacteria bacterium]|jgi:hypothetical protein